MLKTTLAGSLPKPRWLAEEEKLWAGWKLAGDDLAEGQRDATILAVKLQEVFGWMECGIPCQLFLRSASAAHCWCQATKESRLLAMTASNSLNQLGLENQSPVGYPDNFRILGTKFFFQGE